MWTTHIDNSIKRFPYIALNDNLIGVVSPGFSYSVGK